MPSRLEVAAARLDGVLPLSPAWLAKRFPDLWSAARAAEHDIQREVSNTQTPISTLLWEFGYLKTALYRLAGRAGGKPSRVLIRADHSSPEAALAELVGPLAMFRWEAEPAAAEPEPPPDPDDIMNPESWAPAEPEPFTFRGQGPPSVLTVTSIFAIGRRVLVEVLVPPSSSPAVMELAA
jgi:hypothetical protein